VLVGTKEILNEECPTARACMFFRTEICTPATLKTTNFMASAAGAAWLVQPFSANSNMVDGAAKDCFQM